LELGHGAGEYYSAPGRVFLDYGQAMAHGKCPNGGNVGRIRAKLLRELLTCEMRGGAIAAGELIDSVEQGLLCAPPK
jgi:hypothetical protein